MNSEDKENTPGKYLPPHLRKKPLNVNAPAFVVCENPKVIQPLEEAYFNLVNLANPVEENWNIVEKKLKDSIGNKTPNKKSIENSPKRIEFVTENPHFSKKSSKIIKTPNKSSNKSPSQSRQKTPVRSPHTFLLHQLETTPKRRKSFEFNEKGLSSLEKSFKSPSSSFIDDKYDILKDTPENSGPYIHDAFAFDMLQHAVYSNGVSVASQNDNLKTISRAPIDLNIEIQKITQALRESDEENAIPWTQRLKNLARVCEILETEDETTSQLIGAILVYHVQYIIQFNWKYERLINKICKIMISFLSDIVARNLSCEWNKELMAQILIARLIYSRQLGNKWIRRMWRLTAVSIQDILLVNERRNTVYALFNYKTKKLYINCVTGGSLLDAFEWISIQTQNRIQLGGLNDIIVTPYKSPNSIEDISDDIQESIKKFDIYQDSESPFKLSIGETPSKYTESIEEFNTPMSDTIISPSSQQSPQTPEDPFGYIAKVGLQNWIIIPLDTLSEEDSEYIEHKTKQRIHECRHHVIDTSIFSRKLKKPAKKMSAKRFTRFVELRKRQKLRRQQEAQERAELNASEINTQELEIVEEEIGNIIVQNEDILKEVQIEKFESKTNQYENKNLFIKPIQKLVKASIQIAIPETIDDQNKENTPTTPSLNSLLQLKSPIRSAFGPLSPVLISNRQNRSEF